MDEKINHRYKGIYLISDSSFTKGNWGPSVHIKEGINQLSKYFNISLHSVIKRKAKNISLTKKSGDNNFKKNRILGTLRDIKKILISFLNIPKLIILIRNQNIDFIYERSNYLNFSGLAAAKICRIQHFYEKNWVEYEGIKHFYSSFSNKFAKLIEEKCIEYSDHSFFIGNQNEFFDLKKDNWSIVQNGVAGNIFNIELQNKRQDDNIDICFVANLMTHHRFDLFIKALELLELEYNFNQKIVIHLIGSHFEEFISLIPPAYNIKQYGVIAHRDLIPTIKDFDIAIISGGPSYSSFMKLYDYAAAKLIVVCPDLKNLTQTYTNEEIIFFRRENASDMKDHLLNILNNIDSYNNIRLKLYDKVKSNFTWERIFKNKTIVINNILHQSTPLN